MMGATDPDECKTKRGYACRCGPVCAHCGFGKHAAIHGPYFGQPAGSEPYGHEFAPKQE